MEALRRGEVVAYPTETFYGLGARALDPQAVQRLLRIKGRDEGKPIPVLVADRAMLNRIARVPPEAEPLIERHWPGSLTLVLPAATAMPSAIVSREGEVGVRISAHSVARDLVEALGEPLTATSANRAGEPPARSAADVREQLAGTPVLDGGETAGGLPSTVLRFDHGRPVILRPGAVRLT